ncbi:hypothetical protein [Biformimicrobium ophioploci]|uniref:Red chlorophyll catabolite reductase n=1 Tax=Biformimicrobium ophioploci TaxID=3036711 RepID=A0ABQ6LW17_9GAMM|nr:hypothetical protein [Microbulbifer sp. NKW57]GMG86283.1 hypothetical protein MNKW57_06040 [Microbulbifer sp. NKW57]
MHADTKTIDQFLAENPDVDVSKAWERCWGILSDIKSRIANEFQGLQLEPACADRKYYTSPNAEFEGSFQAWSGGDCEWLVHSWLGNRKASILDMNATAYLGQDTDVPHFVMVFGTIPKLFFYFDFMPRRNLLLDSAYLDKYYAPINDEYLALRGHTNFQWSVSHGPYMRALVNPSTQSLMADLNDSNIDILEEYAQRMLSHWLGWYRNAERLPESERDALRHNDHILRRLCYERDPMNKLAEQVFGKHDLARMLDLRMGAMQMARAVPA